MRARCKSDVKVKTVKPKDSNAEQVKPNELWDTIMRAWDVVVDSHSEKVYADSNVQLRKVCEKFPTFLKYVKSTILELLKEKIVKAWTEPCVTLWQHNHK